MNTDIPPKTPRHNNITRTYRKTLELAYQKRRTADASYEYEAVGSLVDLLLLGWPAEKLCPPAIVDALEGLLSSPPLGEHFRLSHERRVVWIEPVPPNTEELIRRMDLVLSGYRIVYSTPKRGGAP